MPYIMYDPAKSPLQFGFFTCRLCGNSFYGGNCAALHASTCPETSYNETMYVFGDRENWALLREIPLPSSSEIQRAVSHGGHPVKLACGAPDLGTSSAYTGD